MPRLRNGIYNAVQFANKCVEFGVYPYQLGRLVDLKERAIRALERNHNYGYNAEPACKRLEAYADKCGFKVRWDDGLYPVLTKNDMDFYIPAL